jgi:hypothetical protein
VFRSSGNNGVGLTVAISTALRAAWIIAIVRGNTGSVAHREA